MLRSLFCGLCLLSLVPAAAIAQLTHSEIEAIKVSAKLKPIAAKMQDFAEAGQISGAVTLVATKDAILHLEAVGQADLAAKRPMEKDTIFAVASMTKPITATALLILVDEGKVKISNPVSQYIPSFKKAALAGGKAPAREVTLRDLLTHTSGVVSPKREPGQNLSLEQLADAIAHTPLAFEPGSKWQYGEGLSVIGRVIEIASGQDYATFLRERIFEPLRMSDTTFHPTATQAARIAVNYKPGAKSHSLEPAGNFINPDLAAKRTPNPSGGLFSTATDMARFYQMILRGGELGGKRIVSREAVEEMTKLHTGSLETGFTPGNGWGLGWCVVQKPQGVSEMLSPGTYGHGGAFGTQGWVDPKRGLIFVLMIQRTGFGNSDGSDLRAAFQRTAVEALK